MIKRFVALAATLIVTSSVLSAKDVAVFDVQWKEANYLIQGGDPLTKKKDRNVMGTGGPGYTLPAEIRLKHVRGTVAMGALPAKVNPKLESNGSQFYICLRNIPTQDGKDTVFGHVASGMDTLMEISNAVVDTNNNPINPIVVTRTYLIDESKLGGQAAKF